MPNDSKTQAEIERMAAKLRANLIKPGNGRIREFFHLHTNNILSHPVCAFFFAMAGACALGAWFSSGEMFAVVPILALGWILAAVGWWWAPGLSPLAKILCIVASGMPFAGECYAIYQHFHAEKAVSGALIISISSQPFTRVDATNYGFPVALTNVGDSPLLDRDWMMATKFSPTVLSKEEEDAVPFFAASSLNKINYWKKEKAVNSVQNVMSVGNTIVAGIHVEELNLTPSQIDDVHAEREKAYVFFLLKYTDSKTPKDQFYVARYCARYAPPAAFTPCHHPNFMKQVEFKD